MQVEIKNPSEDFPIMKRINTELFKDGKQRLYIQKGETGSDLENSGPL